MVLRRFILAYIFSAVALTPIFLWNHVPQWAALLWIIAGLLFYLPAIIPNAGLFDPIVKRFKTTRREVWLTIDDGPHPEDNPQILELLAQYQARATFFLIGQRAAEHPTLVREIVRQGHTLGNHTLSHPLATFWLAGSVRLKHEIVTCSEVLTRLAPQGQLSGFRGPVGMTSFFLQPLLQRSQLKLIGWSCRGFDGVRQDPEKIVERIWKDVFPGAIILLHEGNRPTGCLPVNPRCLALLLERLKLAGYSAVIPSPEQLG
jgi:peptidoglycan-N-acetylglucosamine deacetylase